MAGLGQGLHLHEPLEGYPGLDDRVAAVAGAYIVLHRLDFQQEAGLLQILHNGLTALQDAHTRDTCRPSSFMIAVVGGDGDHRQAVAQAHLEVVGIVGRGDLHHAGAEIHLHIGVRDHRDLPAHQGQNHSLAHIGRIPLVIRVNGHGGVAQQGFGAGGGQTPDTRCRRPADSADDRRRPSFSSNSTSASEMEVRQWGHQLMIRSPR